MPLWVRSRCAFDGMSPMRCACDFCFCSICIGFCVIFRTPGGVFHLAGLGFDSFDYSFLDFVDFSFAYCFCVSRGSFCFCFKRQFNVRTLITVAYCYSSTPAGIFAPNSNDLPVFFRGYNFGAGIEKTMAKSCIGLLFMFGVGSKRGTADVQT